MQQLLLPALLALGCVLPADGAYFEDFDSPGKPEAPAGMRWQRKTQLSFPASWEDMVPGDGFAHLKAGRGAALSACRRRGNPFQTLSIGPVGPGSRLSLRAKNMAVPGLVGLFFTYRGNGTFDEIDIEIVAADTTTGRDPSDGGWTDARFNVWVDADQETLQPGEIRKAPLRDAAGRKVSHRNGAFHIYTIEWAHDSVRFFIDGVQQTEINGRVPILPATLIFGYRRMPWAGEPDWEGEQTMLVDWIEITPLEP